MYLTEGTCWTFLYNLLNDSFYLKETLFVFGKQEEQTVKQPIKPGYHICCFVKLLSAERLYPQHKPCKSLLKYYTSLNSTVILEAPWGNT